MRTHRILSDGLLLNPWLQPAVEAREMWRCPIHLTCRRLVRLGVFTLVATVTGALAAEDDVQRQLRVLQEQNQLLLKQVGQQRTLIEDLGRKVSALEGTAGSREPSDGPASPAGATAGSDWKSALGRVNLTGEGAVGFFHSGARGKFPNEEFRVDEARLFLEAPIWDDTYFVGEINFVTRDEANLDVNLRLGELYLDFENLSRIWGQDGQLALRAGRFYIPFGEEYQVRNAIENPLVSHSLDDLWGVDEGVELYGKLGAVRYVVAVQNGGHPAWRDYTGDKSVAGRLSYDPKKWLHVSVSGMRTGDLSVADDKMSELWFGGGFLRALGSPTNTTEFHAELIEGDVQVILPRGHLLAAGGWIHSADDSPATDTERDVYYYHVEALQYLTAKLYAAARFSQIMAEDGFPIVGNADFRQYFYQTLTTDLWRVSLGLGYRFGPGLVLKGEYSIEEGKTSGGSKRFHQDLFAVQAAFRF